MPEVNIMQTTTSKLLELADQTSEEFVLAVTAAYIAGIARGKAAAQQPEPPAASLKDQIGRKHIILA